MKADRTFLIALVTAPDVRTARKLADAALKARLVACVNLIPKIESHYWWRGRIEKGAEVLLLLKTKRPQMDRLEKLIIQQHPYDTPEFILLDVRGGNRKYLEWWSTSLVGRTGSTQRSR